MIADFATPPGSPQATLAANAWPAGMTPDAAPVYQRNELLMDALPAHVFAWLTRADLWASFYDNAKVLQMDAVPLHDRSRFQWWTFGIPLDTQVVLYEPDRALGWDAHTPGLRAYHKWLLLPEGARTRVITEETDTGPIALLGASFIRNGLATKHQAWLEGLAAKARSGLPTAP